MGKRMRWPAGVLCVQLGMGVVTAAWLAWQGQVGTGLLLLLAVMAMAAIGLAGWFAEQAWGPWLAIAQWLLQVPAVTTPAFSYFLWFGLKVYLYFSLDEVHVGVNVFALAMAAWTLYVMRWPGSPPMLATPAVGEL